MLRGFRTKWSGGRVLLAAFALLALAMRVAAPSGYMLASDGARFLTVELCAGNGNAVRLDLKTGGVSSANDAPDDHSQDSKHEPCAFAATAQVAPSEQAPSLSAPVGAPLVAATSFANDARPGRGLAAPPPWATGPPLTA